MTEASSPREHGPTALPAPSTREAPVPPAPPVSPMVAATPRQRRAGRAWLSLAVVVAGCITAAAFGLARGTSLHDAVTLASLAAGGALLAAIVGWVVLTPLRDRSVGAQAVAVALVVVVCTAAGIGAAAGAMFISSHDLNALLVVLIAAGSAGAAAALRLGARVEDASRAVGELARGIGKDVPLGASAAAPRPPELAQLADEIREVSAELEQARHHERALEQSRRELIAWISHDLRGPLTSIRAMAESMEDGVVDDSATIARYHGAIRAETQRLSAMVDDLFELSRITAGAAGLQMTSVPLADVVDEAVDTVAARADRAGVTLERHYRSLPNIEVSVPEFTRALHNLLDNAIRHTPAGGRIVVEGDVLPGGAMVAVQDECGGIPEHDLVRVFDVAFRGDAARGRDGGGGLGLTIAKGLVEAHQGEIDVTNHDHGCRFTIHLAHDGAGQPEASTAVHPTPRV